MAKVLYKSYRAAFRHFTAPVAAISLFTSDSFSRLQSAIHIGIKKASSLLRALFHWFPSPFAHGGHGERLNEKDRNK